MRKHNVTVLFCLIVGVAFSMFLFSNAYANGGMYKSKAMFMVENKTSSPITVIGPDGQSFYLKQGKEKFLDDQPIFVNPKGWLPGSKNYIANFKTTKGHSEITWTLTAEGILNKPATWRYASEPVAPQSIYPGELTLRFHKTPLFKIMFFDNGGFTMKARKF